MLTIYLPTFSETIPRQGCCLRKKSKGSVSQLMDDLDLIIEQVEVMVNSIQKGVENALRK